MDTQIKKPNTKMGLRSKLIWLFVSIKVIPLVLLAWLAWSQSENLASILTKHYEDFQTQSKESLNQVGAQSITDSMAALEDRARSEIERLTTDTAKHIAKFLYARNDDILLAAHQLTNEESYKAFLQHRNAPIPKQLGWKFSQPDAQWQTINAASPLPPRSYPVLPDNQRAHHIRPPEATNQFDFAPLYHEMTFISVDGQEVVKVTTSDLMDAKLKDISNQHNTFVKAESYFPELKKLKAGEIYVSEVIGEYVPTQFIGTYSPQRAAKEGLEFQPQDSAYAGKENPLGKKFKGIIRWATPVLGPSSSNDNKATIVGYVTLALNHDHIMNITDSIMPTDSRYTNYPDPSEGNYAFIWDHLGRNIAHPRHYFITGYDADTGSPQVPWLEQNIYNQWQQSGATYIDFVKDAPAFSNQNLNQKPAKELAKTGLRGLDCRFLNFAPQCQGWYELTKDGSSGSFIIFWSGLWKLVTAAPIPYYTGRYGTTARGFGIVTIGTNIDEFYAPAKTSEININQLITRNDAAIASQAESGRNAIQINLLHTAQSLGYTTLAMIIAVILIAIWVASYFSNRIITLINGFSIFQNTDRHFRFHPQSGDEITEIASAFDHMADRIELQVDLLENEIDRRKSSELLLREAKQDLEDKVLDRTHELTQEIERRKLIQQRMEYLADHDELTNLPNRRAFVTELTNALKRTKRRGNKTALLYIDLDRFKEVNDSHGHETGDQLLCFVAKLLLDCTRECDTVARLGGDEFAVIMNDIEHIDAIKTVINRLLNRLQHPVVINGHQIQSGISVGVSIYPDNATSPDTLMRKADLALYQVKNNGGLHFQLFDQQLAQKALQHETMEKLITNALENEQFVLQFQPAINYKTGIIESVEALMRIKTPDHGYLLPDQFLEVAERSGLGKPLEKWLLQQVCEKVNQWRSINLEFGRLSFNICARELCKPGYAQQICETIDLLDTPGKYLAIEIMERFNISDFKHFYDNIKQLKAAQIAIILDDVGTEHSSLQRMLEADIDGIKIDRYFVQKIGEQNAESVIAALVSMGQSMGIQVVAEGVETKDQLDFLMQLDCTIIQGFLFARPMPEKELRQYLLDKDI